LEEKVKAAQESVPEKVAKAEAPLKQKIVKLEAQIKDKDAAVPVKVAKAEAPLKGKIVKLEAQIKEKDAAVPDTVAKAKAPLEEKIKALEEKVKAAQESVPEKVAKAEAPLKEKVASLKDEVKALQVKIPEEVAAAVKKAQEKIVLLEKELEDQKGIVTEKEGSVSTLSGEIDRVTIALSSVQQENIFLNNKVREQQNTIKVIESSLTEKFLKEKETVEDKIHFLMGRVDAKERIIQEKEGKIKVLTQEADDLAKDYFEILDENVSLKEKLGIAGAEIIVEEEAPAAAAIVQ
ncbi:MAG: hypothetical protein KAJ18_02175, partial [Candidatus Omnitrophica bacterium]|nr:hypothetical protein [Candidatus Omnitrophota bacterium]